MAFHNLSGRAKHVDENGYVLIYYPEHPQSYQNGHVYYHRVKMENVLGRYLKSSELVHHEDENTVNNKKSNLKLTTRSKHSSIHNEKRYGKSRKKKSKLRVIRSGDVLVFSKICNQCKRPYETKKRSQQWCSVKCAGFDHRKAKQPSKKELKKLVWKHPRTDLAEMFGVSDVAIGKWCKRLGIDMPSRGYWVKYQQTRIDKVKPSRKKLKKLLWKYSVPKLTKKLKVAEGIIRRWSKEYKLKTPPAGYWRKEETGNL